jgi:drug/metabolite transporter (DMT)-like permease
MGGVMLFLFSIPVEGLHFSPKPFEYYAALGWLSFLSAAAFSIWFTLLKRPGVKVSDLNMWKFIIPVFGAIFAWILLPDEHPDVLSIAGMVITGSSLFLLNYLNRKKINR